jgi:hypothetical protein
VAFAEADKSGGIEAFAGTEESVTETETAAFVASGVAVVCPETEASETEMLEVELVTRFVLADLVGSNTEGEGETAT